VWFNRRMAAKTPKKTFEESVEAVESLIEQIETGEIGLEDALKHYEQGTKLIAHCRGILDVAEKKIEKLTAGGKDAADAE